MPYSYLMNAYNFVLCIFVKVYVKFIRNEHSFFLCKMSVAYYTVFRQQSIFVVVFCADGREFIYKKISNMCLI